MGRKVIDVGSIEDLVTKQNFEIVRDAFATVPFLKGSFKFVEIDVPSATTYLFKHNLNFIPKDVILLSSVGAGTVTFNYAAFNLETISLTTTGQVTIRAFIGTYSEN